MHDPFAQFERSRAGLLIPLVLFVVGAVPTAAAIGAMASLQATQAAEGAVNRQVPIGDDAGKQAADQGELAVDTSDQTPELSSTSQELARP
jgi:hypothetical protein